MDFVLKELVVQTFVEGSRWVGLVQHKRSIYSRSHYYYLIPSVKDRTAVLKLEEAIEENR